MMHFGTVNVICHHRLGEKFIESIGLIKMPAFKTSHGWAQKCSSLMDEDIVKVLSDLG